jgi:hypothetical protein
MNIFVLDENPILAAKYHCDKHVTKMTTESLQMMASVHWHSLGIHKKKDLDYSKWQNFPREIPYGIGFANHPCTKWVRESSENWDWHASLLSALLEEHRLRWGKIPLAKEKLEWFKNNKPTLPKIGRTPFVLAMPEELKTKDPVHSYRMFYAGWKLYFAKWKSETPAWWEKYKLLTTEKDLMSDKVRAFITQKESK